MNKREELILRIVPDTAEAIIEMISDGIVSRKTTSLNSLSSCFLTSKDLEETYMTGLLPEGCLAVTMMPQYVYYYIRYPDLYADFSYFGTEYPNFPIPRLVFAFKFMPNEKKVAECAVCVVKDERLAADTPLYRYPFSNVFGDGRICTGNNALPPYKDPMRLHTLAGYLLRMPNNNDLYSKNNNRLSAEFRDLLEQMKGKNPSLYYTDVLVESGKTLKDFIDRR